MTNTIRSNFQDHPFHLVSPSPWPLYTSISLFTLTVNAALSMHLFNNSYIFLYLALGTLVASMTMWFRDIISEPYISCTKRIKLRCYIIYSIWSLFLRSYILSILSQCINTYCRTRSSMTTYGYRTCKSFRITFIKHSNLII
uniref:cytochrome c oxidase subunit 3 n=1 Tax=Epichloe bromicola TaxID=79588 RepID=UPI00226CC87C|nr:cytochrome c oxidase subunit 3 [Epichloe bromicola]UYX62221.1 cytochrome c oxidase subunit 3 [Epichloe bromicola]